MTPRYRADFYLFRHLLAGLGTFRDRRVISCESVKLVFGINQPFRIRLDGKWHRARTALVDRETPHFVVGRGDWQLILWVECDTSLGEVLRNTVLQDRPWALHDTGSTVPTGLLVQTVGDRPDAYGVLRLVEDIAQVYTGVRPVPINWDDGVRDILESIDDDPGGSTVRGLVEKHGRSEETITGDFLRVVGEPLVGYLQRRKLAFYLDERRRGATRDAALRNAGLPGWDGLRDGFQQRFGLELDVLDEGRPYVRVFDGSEDPPARFL